MPGSMLFSSVLEAAMDRNNSQRAIEINASTVHVYSLCYCTMPAVRAVESRLEPSRAAKRQLHTCTCINHKAARQQYNHPKQARFIVGEGDSPTPGNNNKDGNHTFTFLSFFCSRVWKINENEYKSQNYENEINSAKGK